MPTPLQGGSRIAAVAGIALGAGLWLAGCAPTPAPTPTGTVNVEVQTLPEEAISVPVEIVVSVEGAEVATFSLGEGEAQVLSELPFGWLTIEAVGMCSGESELLSTSPTMSLMVGNEGCTFSD